MRVELYSGSGLKSRRMLPSFLSQGWLLIILDTDSYSWVMKRSHDFPDFLAPFVGQQIYWVQWMSCIYFFNSYHSFFLWYTEEPSFKLLWLSKAKQDSTTKCHIYRAHHTSEMQLLHISTRCSHVQIGRGWFPLAPLTLCILITE